VRRSLTIIIIIICQVAVSAREEYVVREDKNGWEWDADVISQIVQNHMCDYNIPLHKLFKFTPLCSAGWSLPPPPAESDP
jgi:hypothetical protein